MQFPQYRKYLNGQSYFKIISAEELIELKLTGRFYEIHTLHVKILPDRNLMHDLLYDYNSFGLEINEKEYEAQLNYCEKHLTKL
jgi:hypothetical protein